MFLHSGLRVCLTLLLTGLLPGAVLAESGEDVARDALGGQKTFSTDRTGPVSAQPWWLDFQDPALDLLVQRAMADSPDVSAQVALAEQARMNGMTAASGLLPSLSFDTTVSGSPTDARITHDDGEKGVITSVS